MVAWLGVVSNETHSTDQESSHTLWGKLDLRADPSLLVRPCEFQSSQANLAFI